MKHPFLEIKAVAVVLNAPVACKLHNLTNKSCWTTCLEIISSSNSGSRDIAFEEFNISPNPASFGLHFHILIHSIPIKEA